MHRLSVICAALITTLGMHPVLAADAANGKVLHDANCDSCHDDGVYTRKERRVTSADGLRKQVQRCEQALGLKWFDEDVDDVTAWLNDNYYHFK